MANTNRKPTEPSDEEKLHLVEVVRHDGKLMLPENLTASQAVQVLQRLARQEEETINMAEKILVYPWDGARALKKALEEIFGVALQNSGFFGSQQIAVESGVDETIQVPWGSFTLPGIEGEVACGADVVEGSLIFVVNASIRRKHEPAVKKLIALTRQIATRESIYRGKAIRMRFRGKDGKLDYRAQPRFMDLRRVEPTVFSEEL